MSIRIRDRHKVPNGGYTYVAPETATEFHSHSIGNLIFKVREHYVANSLPVPPELGRIVEDDWCRRRPELCVDSDDPSSPYHPSNPSGDLITNLAAALAIPAADLLAKASGLLGINCGGCKTRHKIIRNLKKLGYQEALKQLKATFT